MGDVIDFQTGVERKRQKLLSLCKELREELDCLVEQTIISGAPSWVNSHPIPNRHWREGRSLYANCEKERVTEFLFKARGHGYNDLVVEETAFRFEGPEAFIPIEGFVAIYAGHE